MRSRSISTELQMKVSKYLDYIHRKEDIAPEKGQSILSTLPKHLREEVNAEFFGSILDNVKMLRFNFSFEFRSHLSLHMKEILYGPGEVIYLKGDDDKRIFYINNGSVQLYLERNDDLDQTYFYDLKQEDEVFGELNFFTNLPRECCAKSMNVTHIVYCNQEDFIKTLRSFPNDFERFCQMRDELMNNCEKFNTRCQCCKKYQHSISDCPYLHFIRNKQVIIRRYNFSIPIKDREFYMRRQYKSGDPKKKIATIRKNAKKIRQNIVDEAQEESQVSKSDDDDDSFEEIEETDKQFLLRLPAIRFEEGNLYVDDIEQEEDNIDQLEDDLEDSYDNGSVSARSKNVQDQIATPKQAPSSIQNSNQANNPSLKQDFSLNQHPQNNSNSLEVADFDCQLLDQQINEQQNSNNGANVSNGQQSSVNLKSQTSYPQISHQQMFKQSSTGSGTNLQNKMNNSYHSPSFTNPNEKQQISSTAATMFNYKLATFQKDEAASRYQNQQQQQKQTNHCKIDIDEDILRDLSLEEDQINQLYQGNDISHTPKNNNYSSPLVGGSHQFQVHFQQGKQQNCNHQKQQQKLLNQHNINQVSENSLKSIPSSSIQSSDSNQQSIELITSQPKQPLFQQQSSLVQIEEEESKLHQNPNTSTEIAPQINSNNLICNFLTSKSSETEIYESHIQSNEDLSPQSKATLNFQQKLQLIQQTQKLDNINEEAEDIYNNPSTPIIHYKPKHSLGLQSSSTHDTNQIQSFNIQTNENQVQATAEENKVNQKLTFQKNLIESYENFEQASSEVQQQLQESQNQQQKLQQVHDQQEKNQECIQLSSQQSISKPNIKFEQVAQVREQKSLSFDEGYPQNQVHNNNNGNQQIDDEKKEIKNQPSLKVKKKATYICKETVVNKEEDNTRKPTGEQTLLMQRKKSLFSNDFSNKFVKKSEFKLQKKGTISIGENSRIYGGGSQQSLGFGAQGQIYKHLIIKKTQAPGHLKQQNQNRQSKPELQQLEQYQQQFQTQSSLQQQQNQGGNKQNNAPYVKQDTNQRKINGEGLNLQSSPSAFDEFYFEEEKIEKLFLYEFDKMKIFKNYFPNGNYTVILAHMKKKLLQKLMQKKGSSKNIFQQKILNKFNKSQKLLQTTKEEEISQKESQKRPSQLQTQQKPKVRIMDLIKIPVNNKDKTNDPTGNQKISIQLLQPPPQQGSPAQQNNEQ